MIEQYILLSPLSDVAESGERSCGCGPDCQCGPGCACGPAGRCAPACTCDR